MGVLLAFLLWKDILPRLSDLLPHHLVEPVSVSQEKGFSLLPSKMQFLSWAFGGQGPGAASRDLLLGAVLKVTQFCKHTGCRGEGLVIQLLGGQKSFLTPLGTQAREGVSAATAVLSPPHRLFRRNPVDLNVLKSGGPS